MFQVGARLIAGGLGLTGCVGATMSLISRSSGPRFMTVSAKGDTNSAKSIYEFTANNIDGDEVVYSNIDQFSTSYYPRFLLQSMMVKFALLSMSPLNEARPRSTTPSWSSCTRSTAKLGSSWPSSPFPATNLEARNLALTQT